MGNTESRSSEASKLPSEPSASFPCQEPNEMNGIDAIIRAEKLVFKIPENPELYDDVVKLLQSTDPRTAAKIISYAASQFPRSLDTFLSISKELDGPLFRKSLLRSMKPYSMAYFHDNGFLSDEDCITAVYLQNSVYRASVLSVPDKFYHVFRPELEKMPIRNIRGDQINALSAKYLDEYSDDFERRKNDFASPIELAIYNDDFDSLQKIIRENSSFQFNQLCSIPFYEYVMILKNDRIPILSYAALCGSVRCFKYLLLNGSDPSIKRLNADNAMFYAILGGNSEIIALLNEQNVPYMCSATAAVISHRNDLLTWLIQTQNVNISDTICQQNSFVHALLVNNLEAAKILHEADGNFITFESQSRSAAFEYNSLIQMLVSKGYSEAIEFVVQLVRSSNVDLTFQTNYYVCSAISCDEVNTLKVLNRLGIDIHYQKHALHSAARHDSIDVAEYLIDQGFEIDKVDSNMDTPMSVCCKYDSIRVGKFLISRGVNVSQKNSLNRSLLYICIVNNSKGMATILAREGADPNAANNGGVAPLHLACEQGSMEMVSMLASYGADLNARTHFKWTPLHYACMAGKIQIVRYLLDKGVAIDVSDTEGNTPLHYASVKQYSNIVSCINEKLAADS